MPNLNERSGLIKYAADPVAAMADINQRAYHALKDIDITSCSMGVVTCTVQRAINNYEGAVVGAEDAHMGETVSLCILTNGQQLEVECRTLADLIAHSEGRKPPWLK